MSNENQYLIDKPRFLAPVKGIAVFYDERQDTFTLAIDGTRFTLYPAQAWDLLTRLNTEASLAGLVADHKGD